MRVVEIAHLRKSFGTDEVLRDVSLSLSTGERLGLVGTNGSGKTTLLRIIIGEMAADEGSINIVRGLKPGYLSQVFTPAPGTTLIEVAQGGLADLSRIEQRLRHLEQEMGKPEAEPDLQAIMAEYARLTELFERQGGYEADSQVQGVLTGLGFTQEQFNQEASTLSGGELTRLGLASLLLQKPDLLLLDEPTNHLDLATLSWLEGYLADYPGAVILVSHDRYFLNAVCTGIAELQFGSLEYYAGNYTSYLAQREARHAARNKAYVLQQKEIARQRAIIKRFRSFNREKSIRAAESREKALARMELLDRPGEEKQVQFRFEAKRLLGDIALEAEGLRKSFGERALFSNLDLRVRGGDRIGLIGPNGIGKTSLLRCLMGRESLDEGSLRFGPKAQIGYFDQRQQDLNLENDVINEVWDSFPRLNQSQIRGALGLFLFTGDEVFMPLSVLSGGERSRVSLAKLMLRKDNFLILDEPTNHLDADSREALESALAGYEGTLIAVSHDRYFINRIANRIWVMEQDGITAYEGNYDDYLHELQRLSDEANGTDTGITRTEAARVRRMLRQLALELDAYMDASKQAEEAVHSLEKQYAQAQSLMADPEVYTKPDRAAQQAQVCRQLSDQLEAAFLAWEQAETALADFQASQEV